MHRHYFHVSALTFFVATAAFLSSCQQLPATPAYVFGPTAATGTLVRADVSLVRRGTHALRINGFDTYYLESKIMDLRSFEGQTVGVSGTLEPNTTIDDLPVLVTQSVQRVIGKDGAHAWEIPALGIRLSTPENWEATILNAQASFSLSGESKPLLSVEWLSGSVLPDGSPLYIRNRRSVEIDSGTLTKDVYILEQEMLLRLRFDPTTQDRVRTLEEGKVLADQFETILSSITFIRDDNAAVIGTGSGSGAPCGGPAGILCPVGSYCDILDPVNQVGRCKTR